MRRIIFIVLFAFIAYAGCYILVYGVRLYNEEAAGAYRNFNTLPPSEYGNGVKLKGEIRTLLGELGEDTVTAKILGAPIGASVTRRYYILPIGYEEDTRDQKYCLIAFTNDEDAAIADSLCVRAPGDTAAGSGVEFSGRAKDMGAYWRQELRQCIIEDDKLSGLGVAAPLVRSAEVYDRHIVPYTIFVHRESDDNFPLIFSVGGALAAVGLCGVVLILARVYQEKHGY